MVTSMKLKEKEVDDVLGGAEAWENVDQTDGELDGVFACGCLLPCVGNTHACMHVTITTARCPKCSNTRAYFFQLQIRSADEPMTTFYKCVKCAANWNDGG